MLQDLTPEEKQKLVNAVREGKATFMFIPSAMLKDAIAKGEDEFLSQLPKGMPEIILGCPDGKGISLDPSLIMKIVQGNVDARNARLLSMGEVVVKGDVISL